MPSKKGRGFGCLAMIPAGNRMLPRFVPMVCDEEDKRGIKQWKPPKGYKRKPKPKTVSAAAARNTDPFPQGMPPGLVFVPVMMPQHFMPQMQVQVQQQQQQPKPKKRKRSATPSKKKEVWYDPVGTQYPLFTEEGVWAPPRYPWDPHASTEQKPSAPPSSHESQASLFAKRLKKATRG